MPRKAPPINRFYSQISRDGHLTFRKKWRDLVMQIYGHEALIHKQYMADIANCSVCNVDLYRLNTLKWEHLATRKLLNPFKLAEFLIVVPLEFLAWGFQRFTIKAIAETEKKIPDYTLIKLTFELTSYLALLTSLTINILVNLVTGLVRRLLAPVRYIIRPAIETAQKHPTSFLTIVGITMVAVVTLTSAVFAGTLPSMIGSIFLTDSIALNLATIGSIGLFMGTFLTKGLNTIHDIAERLLAKKKPTAVQQYDLAVSNQKAGYPIHTMKTDQRPTKEMLDIHHKKHIPLLILHNEELFLYGLSEGDATQVTKLEQPNNISSDFFNAIRQNEITRRSSSEIPLEIYVAIYHAKAHTPKKVGYTKKIAETFHAIDINRVHVKKQKNQDLYYSAALFTGTESFFYPRRKQLSSTSTAESQRNKTAFRQ